MLSLLKNLVFYGVSPLPNPTPYQDIVSMLIHLTATRQLGITFALKVIIRG